MGRFSDRIIDRIIDHDFSFQMYKFMDNTPSRQREAAYDYNEVILQGRQINTRKGWNNEIDTLSVRHLPVLGREMDMISLLFEHLSFTTHIKTLRDFKKSRLTERIKSVADDYWGSMLADAQMFPVVGSFEEIESGVMRDHEADIVTNLNYLGDFETRRSTSVKMAEQILSMTSLGRKSAIDLNLFYAITSLINDHLETKFSGLFDEILQ